MAPRVIILIEDDWELLGKGLGNVAHLQYLPSLFLMELAESLDIRLTFMVEVMQQLAFLRNSDKNRNIRIQSRLWEENVLLMRERGFDVQLHCHPQWHKARYNDGIFQVDSNWNLASYDRKSRRAIISESLEYLTGLIRKVDVLHKVNSFKAGSWALLPSPGIMSDLENAGIKLVFGVSQNLKFQMLDYELDYTGLEEPVFPYYPCYEDVTRLSENEERIIVQPLTVYEVSLSDKLRRILRRVRVANEADRLFYHLRQFPKAASATPVKQSTSLSGRMFAKMLAQISLGVPFPEFRHAVDSIILRALNSKDTIVPVVIESHTKGFEKNKFKTVKESLIYLVEKYGNIVDFMTLTEYLALLENNKRIIRRK